MIKIVVIYSCCLLVDRLDAIAADAELQERSLHELEQLSITLHDGCVEAETVFRQLNEEGAT